MKDHKVTQRVFCNASNEMEHIAGLYATYLRSTRLLCELEARYKGGEKSVEESAKLVGLALPKRK
uniref:Protein FMC1 homolog n=1 Tax=Heterorhabditis bacteriophora TaxID=37862 RepID=A0A1I7XS17_HETBA